MNNCDIGYKEFQYDVNLILCEVIEKYAMQIDNSSISEDEKCFVCFLVNAHSKIELNLSLNFPHTGLSFNYYLKDKNEFLNIGDNLIPFFDLNIKEIDRHFSDFLEKRPPSDELRRGIQNELEFFKELLEKYFYRLIDGSIHPIDYKKWLFHANKQI